MQNRVMRSCACCLIAFLLSAGHILEAGAREARIVVDFIYSDARDFSEGLAAVKSGDLWGYIDHTGRVAVPFAYGVPEVGPFSGGFAFVGDSFIDVEGNAAFEGRKFDRASSFSEGLAAVQSYGRWGYIDPAGKYVIPPSYEGAGNFSGGLAPVKRNGLWGFIDTQGRLLIGPRYLRAEAFSGNLAAVEFRGRVGYIDRTGRFAVPPRYDEGGTFHGGLAPVRGTETWRDWGYVDARGQEIIPRQFNGAGSFADGLAPVATDARWGYIDVTGRLVIDATYDDARPFSEGLAAAERENKWGYIRVR
ncbi:MAG: WG repeat-containing protein [Synergistaceae bacterium]|nr:WG repeat-containing protein [Synergistaceae bacterium]